MVPKKPDSGSCAEKGLEQENHFYMGFDESWRWRYEVADLYHQRFWNQLKTRVMERPFLSAQPRGIVHGCGGKHTYTR